MSTARCIAEIDTHMNIPIILTMEQSLRWLICNPIQALGQMNQPTKFGWELTTLRSGVWCTIHWATGIPLFDTDLKWPQYGILCAHLPTTDQSSKAKNKNSRMLDRWNTRCTPGLLWLHRLVSVHHLQWLTGWNCWCCVIIYQLLPPNTNSNKDSDFVS